MTNLKKYAVTYTIEINATGYVMAESQKQADIIAGDLISDNDSISDSDEYNGREWTITDINEA